MNKTTILLIAFFAVNVLKAQQVTQQETKFPDAKTMSNKNLTYSVISSPGSTFGYDIFADSKLLIHQPSVPGLTGNVGFRTKQSAEKIALLVIEKIRKGEMPPSVTEKEMRDLKAIP
ncbi:MAG: DUF4907 domain-containing protein [Bacteroidota bacterium]